jgi:hypothetical protein
VRADIHDGQEHKRSMQGPDTDAQDQPPRFTQIRLATHGRSIQSGQTRKSASPTAKSAFPPRTDIVSSSGQVRKVPTGDISLEGKANTEAASLILDAIFVTLTLGCCNTIRFHWFSNPLTVRPPCIRRRSCSCLRFCTLATTLANQTRSIRAKGRRHA